MTTVTQDMIGRGWKVKHCFEPVPYDRFSPNRREPTMYAMRESDTTVMQNVIGEYRVFLLRGDVLDVLGTLSEKARLIFADPPYNQGKDYGSGKKADRLSTDGYLNWCHSWMIACWRTLAYDGSLWVVISEDWADRFGVLLRSVGFHRRSWIIWYETFGVNCTRKFNRCARHIFHCVKDPKNFVFNTDAIRRPSDRQAKYHDKRANPDGKLWDNVWKIPRLTGNAKERVAGVPTQIPEALMRPIISCASNPGDLVLDPFVGSGTTCVVAAKLGRRSIGIDLNPDYLALAEKRIANALKE